MIKISKVPQCIVNSINTIKQASAGSLQKRITCDSFEKTTDAAGKKINQIFTEVLNLSDIPTYKSSDNFKKPILGIIGKSGEQQALAFNSSDEIQQQTLKCIQDVEKYITQQAEAKKRNKNCAHNGLRFLRI